MEIISKEIIYKQKRRRGAMPRRHFFLSDILIPSVLFGKTVLTKGQHRVIHEGGNIMVQQISDAELEIMKIVWGNQSEVTLFPYIMDGLAARGKPCQKNTLIVLLSRLMNKGFLSAKKIGRRNEYTTLVSETEYQTAQTKNFLDKIYEGSAKGLVSNLIMGDLLADEEYEELKRLLEKGKGQQ
jgi:BlaI family penicillinase repressor